MIGIKGFLCKDWRLATSKEERQEKRVGSTIQGPLSRRGEERPECLDQT